MARGISGALRTLFAADHFIPRFKVELESPDGIYVDIATLLGEDYFDGVRLETDIDNPTVTGTLWLRRDIAGKSLSPLMGSSLANRDASNAYVAFLKAARYIRISIGAKVPGGAEPTEWVRVINDGKVDRVKFAKEPIELSFSDKTKWLTHKYIEDETARYSSDTTPISLETALQQVLTANPAPRIGVATFATPVSPAWNVGAFTPTGNLLEAIRAITLSIGWEWRERWSSLTDNEFRLYSPNRGATLADWSFGPTEYFEVRELESNDDDIRNRITVNYVGLDGKPASVTRDDLVSQAEYGIRFMGISKDKTASVRTSAQATALGDRALSDLAQPGAEHEIRTSIAPFVELGDLIAHTADGILYDSTQTYAVVGLSHEFRNGHGESTFKTRGKPAAAWRRWLEIGDDAETPLPPNSTLDVFATQFATTYSISWSGNGATTLSIDGGAYATPPASPIVVTRNPAGGATKVYRFRTILGDDVTYETIYVLPIGADTVTPDISVVPAVPATLTQSYTVTASNPSGGTAPTIQVFAVGCSGIATEPGIGGATHAITDGASPTTLPSGTVVAMTRPAYGSGAGSVVFAALISGGGRAEIQRTVTPRQSTGPNLTVTPTPYSSTYSIAWSGDGVELSIDGGAFAAPSASPIIVNRPAIGQPDKLYTFRGFLDGQTVTNSITIPAIGSPESPNLTVVQGTETDTTIQMTASATAPGGGGAPTIVVYLTDCTADVADGSTIASGTTVTVNRPAFALKRAGSIRFRATIGTSYEEISRTVPPQVQTSFGPNLTVVPTAYASTYSLSWAGDNVQLSIDGGAYITAPTAPLNATPIIVNRPAVGQPDTVYTFRGTKDGQEVTNSITVPAIGSAETPNLNVVASAPTATAQSFVVTATAPSGATPTVVVYFSGCTSSTHADGATVASGATVTVNRPDWGTQAGTVRFRATVGSSFEEISRTIVSKVRDTIPLRMKLIATRWVSTGGTPEMGYWELDWRFYKTLDDGTQKEPSGVTLWATEYTNTAIASNSVTGAASYTVTNATGTTLGAVRTTRVSNVPAMDSVTVDITVVEGGTLFNGNMLSPSTAAHLHVVLPSATVAAGGLPVNNPSYTGVISGPSATISGDAVVDSIQTGSAGTKITHSLSTQGIQNRLSFQSTTSTGNVELMLLPGTSVSQSAMQGQIQFIGQPGNDLERLSITMYAKEWIFDSTANGFGTMRAMVFYMGGSSVNYQGSGKARSGAVAMLLTADASVRLRGSVQTIASGVNEAGGTYGSERTTIYDYGNTGDSRLIIMARSDATNNSADIACVVHGRGGAFKWLTGLNTAGSSDKYGIYSYTTGIAVEVDLTTRKTRFYANIVFADGTEQSTAAASGSFLSTANPAFTGTMTGANITITGNLESTGAIVKGDVHVRNLTGNAYLVIDSDYSGGTNWYQDYLLFRMGGANKWSLDVNRAGTNVDEFILYSYGIGSVMRCDYSNGRVTFQFDVYGSAFQFTSDARLKENVEPIADALAIVRGLRGRSFRWKKGTPGYPTKGYAKGGREYGLIAQEVERVLPEAVKVAHNGDKTLNVVPLVAMLVEALHQLDERRDG